MTTIGWLARVLLGAVVAMAAAVATMAASAHPAAPALPTVPLARSGTSADRFSVATDSSAVAVADTGLRSTPVLGGAYGGYIGMVGDWARWTGCARYALAWSQADAVAARDNRTRYHAGVGVGGYWFMGGPGVDPHYDGTTAEARRWGERQGAAAVQSARARGVQVPVLFMDVELPGSTVFDPVVDNGWNAVYRSPCDAERTHPGIPAALDRASVDGFAAWVRAHSSYRPGVYSAPAAWRLIFGTGQAATLSGLPEWTYGGSSSALRPPPRGFCRSLGCASFFGGISASSPQAVAWQWSGGGGMRNGVGDFDIVDTTRLAGG